MASPKWVEALKLTEELVKTDPKKATKVLRWFMRDWVLTQQELLQYAAVENNIDASMDAELLATAKELESLARELSSKLWDKTEKVEKWYEWMTKIRITIKWKEKDIWFDNENLRVDSLNWIQKTIWWVRVKINPEWDITEYIDWPEAWQQLFTYEAAQREAKKLWKRLPFAHDENNEFQLIIDKVWDEELMSFFPGYRNHYLSDFWNRGDNAYFWSASVDWDSVDDFYSMAFFKVESSASRYLGNRSDGLSVRCVKD